MHLKRIAPITLVLFGIASCGSTTTPTSTPAPELERDEDVTSAPVDEAPAHVSSVVTQDVRESYCERSFHDEGSCVPWLDLQIEGEEDSEEYANYDPSIRHPNGEMFALAFSSDEDGSPPCSAQLSGARVGEFLIVEWQYECRCNDCSEFQDDPCIASEPWIGTRETAVLKLTRDDLRLVTFLRNTPADFEAEGAVLTQRFDNGEDRVVDLTTCTGCPSLLTTGIRRGNDSECGSSYDCQGGACVEGQCRCSENAPCEEGSACVAVAETDRAICVDVPSGCDPETTASEYSRACYAAVLRDERDYGDHAELPCRCASAFAETGSERTQRALYYNVGRHLGGSEEGIAAFCRSLSIEHNDIVERDLNAVWGGPEDDE